MSHKLAKNNDKYHNKPSKSASKQSQAQSWTVGDSCLHLSHCITNATGTFSRFISFTKQAEYDFPGTGPSRPSSRGSGPHTSAAASGLPRKIYSRLFIVLLLTLISVSLIGSNNTYATSSSLTVSVTSGSGAYVNIPPTAEGKFGSTGATTFSITTTHAAGYTLTASATDLSFKDTEGTNGAVGTTYTINNLVLPTGTDYISTNDFEDNVDYKNM